VSDEPEPTIALAYDCRDQIAKRSVALTIVERFGNEEEGAFTVTVRAAGEVDASGDALTGTYTVELTLPDGTRTGEYGPGTVEGTRIAVEPMGTPLGTLEELFAQFEEATPRRPPRRRDDRRSGRGAHRRIRPVASAPRTSTRTRPSYWR
jgi:hypothetical protein